MEFLHQWQTLLHLINLGKQADLKAAHGPGEAQGTSNPLLFLAFLEPIQSHKHEPMNSNHLFTVFEQNSDLNADLSGYGATFSSCSWRKFVVVGYFYQIVAWKCLNPPGRRPPSLGRIWKGSVMTCVALHFASGPEIASRVPWLKVFSFEKIPAL